MGWVLIYLYRSFPTQKVFNWCPVSFLYFGLMCKVTKFLTVFDITSVLELVTKVQTQKSYVGGKFNSTVVTSKCRKDPAPRARGLGFERTEVP